MKVAYLRTFREDYNGLSEELKGQVKDALKQFVKNPRHPSLRVKKVQGTNGEIWEGSVTMAYRFTFHWEKHTVVFRRVGTHKILSQES